MTLKIDDSDKILIVKGPSELDILRSLFRADCNIPEVTRFQSEFATGCHFQIGAPLDMTVVAVIDGASRHPTIERSIWELSGHFNDHIADTSYKFAARYDVKRRTGIMEIEDNWWERQAG